MRIAFYPFCSQQDKRSGKFLLDSDSGVRMYSHLVREATKRGWEATLILPDRRQCVDAIDHGCPVATVSFELDPSNLRRRFQLPLEWLDWLASQFDVIVTTHVALPFAMMALHPNVQTVVEAGFAPGASWAMADRAIPLNWAAADAVHCSYESIVSQVKHPTVFRWRFGYEDAVARARPGVERDVDVLFVARCSANSYTNHSAFLCAMQHSELKAVMTDPTSFLRPACPTMIPVVPLTKRQLVEFEHRSKVVVGLLTSGAAGFAFPEAIAAGCCPVALRTPAHIELLGEAWPYYCKLDNILEVTRRAVKMGWAGCPTKAVRAVQENIKKFSYSAATEVALHDLEELCR